MILAANLMAMLIQSMSAKLGIATGMNLPEVCRERFRAPVAFGLWVQAEVIAMATDLAEFIGAALGLNLLFGIPLFLAGVLTGVVAFAILALQARGFRHARGGDRRPRRRDRARLRVRRSFLAEPSPARRRARALIAAASPAPRACCWRSASSARP